MSPSLSNSRFQHGLHCLKGLFLETYCCDLADQMLSKETRTSSELCSQSNKGGSSRIASCPGKDIRMTAKVDYFTELMEVTSRQQTY